MSGFVYLIGPVSWQFGRVKIGRTTGSPHARLSALQTGSPVRLDVYGYFRGGAGLERALHETFAPLRTHGEWFRLTGKLQDFVSNVTGQTFGIAELSQDALLADLIGCVCNPDRPLCMDDGEFQAWQRSADVAPLHAWLALADATPR